MRLCIGLAPQADLAGLGDDTVLDVEVFHVVEPAFDLLADLQKRRGLSYLFISHDLEVVRALASDIVVMRGGRVVESGPAAQIFAAPREDYTRALLAAALDQTPAPAEI